MGRRAHLQLQEQGLRRSECPIRHRVVVAMGDEAICGLSDVEIVTRVPSGDRLPLARARNEGARAAIAAGADLLIFLDVDCIPAPRMVGRYLAAAQQIPNDLLCGPVQYLDPPAPTGYDLDQLLSPHATGHSARPVPGEDECSSGGDHALFWSLSFALTVPQWTRIGGFDERYEGYGAEDTDFGQRAKANDVGLTWVGGAWAFHQHHPTSYPPTEHLEDILRNAELFHDRWGWWPMQGWLEGFRSLGLLPAGHPCFAVAEEASSNSN
jgi:GT2 family glycosyltransferase